MADTYTRTFHPNWAGIIGTSIVAALLVGGLIVAWRRSRSLRRRMRE